MAVAEEGPVSVAVDASSSTFRVITTLHSTLVDDLWYISLTLVL